MNKKRRIQIALWTLLTLAIFAVPIWIITAKIRRDQINHDFILAVKRYDAEAAERLLKQGADANGRDIPFDTRSETQRVLDWLRHRPEPDYPNADYPQTPPALILALTSNTPKPDSSIAYIGDPPPIPRSQEPADDENPPENPALIRALLEHGANCNIRDGQEGRSIGLTPLMLAAEAGHCQSFALLLQFGADPAMKDYIGGNALHDVALEGSLCALKQLLSHGVDVNVRDDHGNTALITAMGVGDNPKQIRAKVEMLLQYHADVNCVSDYGETALSEARKYGLKDVVKMLVAAGAKK